MSPFLEAFARARRVEIEHRLTGRPAPWNSVPVWRHRLGETLVHLGENLLKAEAVTNRPARRAA
jgi:hypothetical protein